MVYSLMVRTRFCGSRYEGSIPSIPPNMGTWRNWHTRNAKDVVSAGSTPVVPTISGTPTAITAKGIRLQIEQNGVLFSFVACERADERNGLQNRTVLGLTPRHASIFWDSNSNQSAQSVKLKTKNGILFCSHRLIGQDSWFSAS